MRRFAVISLFAAAAAVTGCFKVDEAQSFVDKAMFRRVGGTMFSTPDLISMKEIHLEAEPAKKLD